MQSLTEELPAAEDPDAVALPVEAELAVSVEHRLDVGAEALYLHSCREVLHRGAAAHFRLIEVLLSRHAVEEDQQPSVAPHYKETSARVATMSPKD